MGLLKRNITPYDTFLFRSAARPLLFSDPGPPADAALRAAALAPVWTFASVVARCQDAGELPARDPVDLAGLIYATMHGATDLEIGGRAGDHKGLGDVSATVALLLQLLKSHPR